MENYFNYFTEIEERFQRRRGTGLLLSTLDWALIETWKDSGIPLEAVLSGIDATFDKYDRRPSKTRKINSLAYCAQEVLASAEDMKEAAVGAQREEPKAAAGLEAEEIARYLRRNAAKLMQVGAPAQVLAQTPDAPDEATTRAGAQAQSGESAHVPAQTPGEPDAAGASADAQTAPSSAKPGLAQGSPAQGSLAQGSPAQGLSGLPGPVRPVAVGCANVLEAYAEAYSLLGSPFTSRALEDLERLLTVLEEKLLAALTIAATEAELVTLRAEADRAIAPYRSKMPGLQIEQLQKQFVHKRLFEKATIPRLSLFYM